MALLPFHGEYIIDQYFVCGVCCFNFDDDYIVSLHFIIIHLSTANRESAQDVKFFPVKLMYGHIGHAPAQIAMEHAYCDVFGK